MSVIPTLRRLVPYYRPYIRMLVTGLTVVVISSAIGAVNAAPVAQAIVEAYFHIRHASPSGTGLRD